METPKKETIETLKAAKSTNPFKLAGALVNIVQKGNDCDILAIGAGAINQAIKSIAIANRMLGSNGISLSCKPCFTTVNLSSSDDDSQVTAIRFKIIVEA